MHNTTQFDRLHCCVQALEQHGTSHLLGHMVGEPKCLIYWGLCRPSYVTAHESWHRHHQHQRKGHVKHSTAHNHCKTAEPYMIPILVVMQPLCAKFKHRRPDNRVAKGFAATSHKRTDRRPNTRPGNRRQQYHNLAKVLPHCHLCQTQCPSSEQSDAH